MTQHSNMPQPGNAPGFIMRELSEEEAAAMGLPPPDRGPLDVLKSVLGEALIVPAGLAALAGKLEYEQRQIAGAALEPANEALQRAGLQGFGDPRKPLEQTGGMQAAQKIMEQIPPKAGLGEAIAGGVVQFGTQASLPAIGALVAGPAGAAVGAGLAAASAFGASMLEFAEDARRSGAKPEDIARAADIGLVVGASEVVPLGAAWRAIRRSTPKPLRAKMLRSILGAGTAEGLQEAFQQWAQNTTARDWVGYDPDREPLEGVFEGAAVGFGAGTIATALLEVALGRRVRVKLDESGKPQQVEVLDEPPRTSIVPGLMSVEPQAGPGLDVTSPEDTQFRPPAEGRQMLLVHDRGPDFVPPIKLQILERLQPNERFDSPEQVAERVAALQLPRPEQQLAVLAARRLAAKGWELTGRNIRDAVTLLHVNYGVQKSSELVPPVVRETNAAYGLGAEPGIEVWRFVPQGERQVPIEPEADLANVRDLSSGLLKAQEAWENYRRVRPALREQFHRYVAPSSMEYDTWLAQNRIDADADLDTIREALRERLELTASMATNEDLDRLARVIKAGLESEQLLHSTGKLGLPEHYDVDVPGALGWARVTRQRGTLFVYELQSDLLQDKAEPPASMPRGQVERGIEPYKGYKGLYKWTLRMVAYAAREDGLRRIAMEHPLAIAAREGAVNVPLQLNTARIEAEATDPKVQAQMDFARVMAEHFRRPPNKNSLAAIRADMRRVVEQAPPNLRDTYLEVLQTDFLPFMDPELGEGLESFGAGDRATIRAAETNFRRYYKLWQQMQAEAKRFRDSYNDLGILSRYVRVDQLMYEREGLGYEPVFYSGLPLFDPRLWRRLLGKQQGEPTGQQLDRYNRFLGHVMTLLQLARENPHIGPLQEYVGLVRNWWTYKARIMARADDTLREWHRLSPKRLEALHRFMLAVTLESDRLERRLNAGELLDLARRTGLDKRDLRLWARVDRDMRHILDELQSIMLEDLQREYLPDNPVLFEIRAKELEKQFARLRNRNYFPLTRFGQYYVEVRTMRKRRIDGKEYGVGEVVYFETFETKRQQRKRYEELKRRYAGNSWRVSGAKLEEQTDAPLVGLPPNLVQMIRERLMLTPEQQELLSDIIVSLSPAHSWLRHLMERKGTPGFSTDGMRVYAAYMMKAANSLARMRYSGPMRDALRDLRRSVARLRMSGGIWNKRAEIADWVQRHFEYIMDPPNEWANIRAAGFLWYLGYNVKSAWVNLTQPIMLTLPYLTKRYGNLPGMAAMAKAYGVDVPLSGVERVLHGAMRDAVQSYQRRGLLEPGLQQALRTLYETGILDESLATELAAATHSSIMERLLARPGTGRTAGYYLRMVARWGAWPFQMAEKLNRRVTAIATWRLEMRRLGRRWEELTESERQQVIRAMREAIEQTQYEYAQWNRPELFRGKKGVVFLFYSWLQNTLYFLFRDPAKLRGWLMVLAAGGLFGLPGVEDMIDLLDAALTQWPQLRRLAGLDPKPMTHLRTEIRRALVELTEDRELTELLLRGWSSKYGLGPLHALEFAGVPVPNVDISGSLSMGRILPAGPRELRMLAYGRSGKDIILGAAEQGLGAAANIPLAIIEAVASTIPDQFQRFDLALPKALQGVWRAYHWAEAGEARGRRGEQIVAFNPWDPRHNAELIAQSLGFMPARYSLERRKRWEIWEQAMFYETRRRLLMAEFAWAYRQGDERALRLAREEIRRWNHEVPDKTFTINAMQLVRSIRQRIRSERMIELFGGPNRTGTPLRQELEQLYPEPEPSVIIRELTPEEAQAMGLSVTDGAQRQGEVVYEESVRTP